MRRVLITGASGFLGRVLRRELLAQFPNATLLLLDRQHSPAVEGAQLLLGDLSDPAILGAAADFRPDTVFHLASVPGAAAEADPALGRRVNLDASLNLLANLAAGGECSRVVYASSVAVYGALEGRPVDDDTPARPGSIYGTHKRMVELALADHTRRGELSGLALRLPGIVARAPGAVGFGSAFMSDLLWALRGGEPYVCPVGPGAAAWWLSAVGASRALLHAAATPQTGALLVPAQWLSVAEVVAGLSASYGTSPSLVTYRPVEQIEAPFGRFPPLHALRAQALGYSHDGSVQDLLHRALETSQAVVPGM